MVPVAPMPVALNRPVTEHVPTDDLYPKSTAVIIYCEITMFCRGLIFVLFYANTTSDF